MKKTTESPSGHFKRRSLVEQVAESFRVFIANGTWNKYLPSERALCDIVNVSRPIVRRAIHYLEEEGLVKTIQGHPAKIVRRSSARRAKENRRVMYLFGESWENVSQWTIIAIDEIRKELYDRGFYLDMVSSLFRKRNVEGVLQRLLDQHAAHCWILAGVPYSVQNWFQERHLKAVVMGNAFPQIRYPFVNDDLSGVTRHAAGVFLGLGHQDIVFFMRQLGSAGEAAEEAGFLDAFRISQNASCHVVKHSGEVKQIRAALQRIFSAKKRPTAVLFSHAIDTLAATVWFLEQGIHIPRDVSLISFQWESFLETVRPLPACYRSDPREHARKLCRLIATPWHQKKSPTLIIPKFFKNGTLAPPRA